MRGPKKERKTQNAQRVSPRRSRQGEHARAFLCSLDKKKTLRLLLHLLCAAAVMASAVLMRSPSAALAELKGEQREIFFSDGGVPYLTDLDSYYHVRLVDNELAFGSLGDTSLDDGSVWDSLRFYPEGLSADYPPGIVHLTEAVWHIRNVLGNVSLEKVDSRFPS